MDCSLGDICEAGRCVSPVECQIDIDCEAGERCDAGSCVSVGECQADGDCDAGEICEVDTCRAGCRGNDDCPGNQICDPGTFTCAEPMMCQDDVDCLDGRVCADGACQAPAFPCEDDGDCPGGGTCENGACFGVPVCDGDEDCVAPLTCVAGVCELPAVCDGDEDCLPGQVCNVASGACQAGICPDLPVLAEGVPQVATLNDGDQRFNLDCPTVMRPNAVPSDAWRFNLAANGAVTVAIAGIDANVWILEGCTLGSDSVLGCGAAPLVQGVLQPGDYTIVVEGQGGATGAYNITLQVDR